MRDVLGALGAVEELCGTPGRQRRARQLLVKVRNAAEAAGKLRTEQSAAESEQAE